MTGELVVFWRHVNGTRCVVVGTGTGTWQLQVLCGEERLLVENYLDPRVLLQRAMELRGVYRPNAA
jgi:hypothetical protein